MATSINLRINDEIEKRLKEKVVEIKKNTPVGAEVNNSTVIRGALIDFFERIDKKKSGERTINFNLRNLTDSELSDIDSLFDSIIEQLEKSNCKKGKAYLGALSIINAISTEFLDELIERKSKTIKL